MADYVLDSFALIAYFDNEPGGEQMKDLIGQAFRGDVKLHMSIINLGEVYYILYRDRGKPEADTLITTVQTLPIDITPADAPRVMAAAEMKARIPFSYGDAFAAALARELDAPLVTGDPEFQGAKDTVAIMWLPT